MKASSILLISLFTILSISTISCSSRKGNEPTSLSEGKVTQLVKSYMKEHHMTPAYANFRIGRFRCDDKDSRNMYRKLDLAGVITLKIDTTNVIRTVKTGTDWWTGRPEYSKKSETIYTLTSNLTEETQQYIETKPETGTIDLDMEQPEIGDFPEFHLDEAVFDTPAVTEGAEASKTVFVKGTDISLVKVRNIKVGQNNKGSAFFECIIQNGNVTPAYRVLNKSYEKEKTLLYGVLTYYVDKGWTIVSLSAEKPDIENLDSFLSGLSDLLS